MQNKSRNYYLVIVEIGLYFFSFFCFFFISRGIFAINKKLPDSTLMSIYLPIFALAVSGMLVFLYYDYKYNDLKIKKIFLLIFILINLTNLISLFTLPSTVFLPYDSSISISVSDRLYSCLHGIMLGFIPFLVFYVIPRKFRHKKYLTYFLTIILAAVTFSFVFSLFKDFNNYTITIKSHFSDMSHASISFFLQKNIYGRFLFVGICSAIFLHIYTKKKYWLLFLIPFFIGEIFSFSKMTIFLSAIFILCYFIYIFVKNFKFTKDNKIIVLISSSFVCFFIVIFSVLISFSQTGFLYSIKRMFLNFGNSAIATFKTRLVIWDCTFKLLKPYQIIFGFNFTIYGNAIHAVYDTRHLEDTADIWTAHNSVIEMIAEGGIIYLLINLLFVYWIIKMTIKTKKYNTDLTIMNIALLVLLVFLGFTDSLMIFNESDNLLLSALLIIPVVSEYYNHVDENEILIRKNMIKNENYIKKSVFKSKLLNFNKKLFLVATKNMKEEYKD